MPTDPPKPRFNAGDRVDVVTGGHNRTPHTGLVERVVWHHKDACWHFYIQESGRKISKRYRAEDLNPAVGS